MKRTLLVFLVFACRIFAVPASGQSQPVTGQVTTADGEVLPGVNVLVKGTPVGTVTDADGKYSITLPASEATLVFSFIGYQPQEVEVGGRIIINVSMTPDVQLLGQVVVIGYGEQKKMNLTSAQSSITGDEITRLPVASADQALQGRAAGVVVTQNDGSPGGGVSVRIRGVASTGNNEPLYIIDGFPLMNENAATTLTRDAQQPSNALAGLNPNDIESIEVLKDASAAAIYGSRAANGVVIITTKRGKQGSARFNFDAYYGVQQISKKLPLLNAQQFAELANEALTNSGETPNPAWQNPSAITTNTDWQDAIFSTAPIQNYNISVQSGSEKLQAAMSVNYFKQDGILINTDFERVSARANIDFQASRRLKIGASITPSRTFSNEGNTSEVSNGVLMNALRFHPDIPVFDDEGYSEYPVNALYYPNSNRNPVGQINSQTRTTERLRLLGTVFAELEIIDGLVWKTNLGTDVIFGKGTFYDGRYSKGSHNIAQLLQSNRNESISWLAEHTLTYSKSFADKHHLSILGGMTAQEFSYDNVNFQGGNFLNDDIINIGSAQSGRDVGGSFDSQTLLSYLGRVSYSYDDKYLLSSSIRRDGSSKFGPNNRWGIFPSVSVGWRLSAEPFMAAATYVSDLKVRASWGVVGNQEIPAYRFLTNISSSPDVGASFGGGAQAAAPGAVATNISNPDIKWESNTTVDVGLDLSLFDNKFSITADYFIKNSNDLLVNAPLPSTSGFSNRFVNAGEIRNKGLELALTYRRTQGDLSFDVTGNFATLDNEVITLGVGAPIFSGGAIGSLFGVPTVSLTEPGTSVGAFFGHVTDGIFQNQQEIDAVNALNPNRDYQIGAVPGDFRFRDLNADGIINDLDRQIIGNPIPRYNFGLTINVYYKNWDFSAFLQGVSGVDIFNGNRLELYAINNRLSSGFVNGHEDVYKYRWTGEGTSNTIPRLSDEDVNNNFRASDFMIEDGSFVRMRNIQIGYKIPVEVAGRAGLSSVRLYVAAQNLFTITSYSGLDPEIGSFRQNALLSGIDLGKYPNPRTFLMGVNVQF